jgi:putative nucleotidyltransferase with HDIG domain
MSALAVSGLVSPEALDAFIRRVEDISTLPHVALKVVEVANNEQSGAADLKAVLQSDPPLSARVLRCVNSAAYSLRTRVTNLQLAITYLGCKQVRNLAITASVSDLFKNNQPIGLYRRTELWRHVVAVGICARLVAMRLRMANFEDAFLAGLLHDLGIILEDQHAHEPFQNAMLALSPGRTLVETEREHLGFDHTIVGDRVAANWNLPEAVRAAIRHHHSSAAYRGEAAPVLYCVEVANWLCTLKQLPSVGLNLLKPPTEAIRGLCLKKNDILVLSQDLDRELDSHRDLFLV